MLTKKITEPQAQYTKAPTPGGQMHTSFTTPPSKHGGAFNWKVVSGVVTVGLVVVVGIAGVLIAQRQQNQPGPVAPNAPESKPAALVVPPPRTCTLEFTVGAPPTPTPTPSSIPVPGAAKCLSKTASLIKGTISSKPVEDVTRTPLAANATVKPGDIIEYKLQITADKNTGEVTMADTLPAQLEYITGTARIGAAPISSGVSISNNLLTMKMAAIAANAQWTFSYKARVRETAAAGSFTNAVNLTTAGITGADTSCKLTLAVQPPSGTAECLSKIALKENNSEYGSNALADRGAVITYKLTVTADQETSGPVVVTDVLPTAVSYVPNSAKIGNTLAGTKATFTDATRTLKFELGSMSTTTDNRTFILTYQATVKTDAPIASFSNAAKAITNAVAGSASNCSAKLQVTPTAVAKCESKQAFTDYNGTAIAPDSIVTKGSTMVYRITVTANETTAGSVVVVDTLPDRLEFVESKDSALQYNSSTRKITATIATMGDTAATKTKTFEYKVRVKTDAAAGDFTNTATVTTASKTTQADSCPLTLRIAYQCNSSCSTDDQCASSGNASYICSADQGSKCRLSSNVGSSSCENPSTSYACNTSCENNNQCQQANGNYVCSDTSQGKRCRLKDYESQANCEAVSTPTPTPAIGCNASCVTNADCSNPDHICYTTSSGAQQCRLDTNPTSTTCTTPGVTVAQTPTQTLPQQLPQTGPEDWINWLKAGLITLGIGAVLLLLL
ncbi:MAG: hypothetical protein COY81_01785 [Candidatus Pacebacteria bacterium CG_4_10_14_0_8_um_filter_43_12]|nr:MAG: hypothetical protein COU66_01345 [Candidatus Pacebacteria bacterium CG10_big_fil_rev_8_21_14_0_10_44_11]PIY79584.1 MAG: hypothetical protein COY81_01785 [Candidatus Pacebacteria bacterium CG_4_10_14_0_8_um_filter_43_12]